MGWLEYNRAELLDACYKVGTLADMAWSIHPEVSMVKVLFGINWAESRGEMERPTTEWLLCRGSKGEIGPPQLLKPYILDAREHLEGRNNKIAFRIDWRTTMNVATALASYLDEKTSIDACRDMVTLDGYQFLVASYLMRWVPKHLPTEPAELTRQAVIDVMAKVHHYGGPRAEPYSEYEWAEYAGYYLSGYLMTGTVSEWLKPTHFLKPHMAEHIQERRDRMVYNIEKLA